MKKIKLFAVILAISLSYSTTAQNVGIGEPNPSEKLDVNGRIVAKGYKNTILTKVGSTNISLTASGVWTDVPDLSQTFNLDAATTVVSSFSMSLFNAVTGGSNILAALRLEIDGVGYSPSLHRFNIAQFHTLTNQHIAELSAGSHTVKVQYFLFGAQPFQNSPNPFQERKLQILIFGSN